LSSGDYILVFNSGSSTLKFKLFEVTGDALLAALGGLIRDFGSHAVCDWAYRGKRARTTLSAADHATAAGHVFALLEGINSGGSALLDSVAAIGHRIVHGGECFVEPILLTEETLAVLDTVSVLAPLHNPPALSVVHICRERFPDIPMVGVFDTAFFHVLPEPARVYALPAAWTQAAQPVRRYGFHGLAHRYMAERLTTLRAAEQPPSRVITLQLGHGCSIAALRNGRPVETSMGFTPLEGLIMATRPGDIDAGVLLHLLEQGGVTAQALKDGLNHRAGLLGLSGATADMRELLALEAQGHTGAHLAVEAFCHRVRKYIGAYLAVLGGADAVVFGGGIGEHAPTLRARICAGMEWSGLQLDEPSNQSAVGEEARISTADASVAIHVIPVDEESLIAQDTLNGLRPAHSRINYFSG